MVSVGEEMESGVLSAMTCTSVEEHSSKIQPLKT